MFQQLLLISKGSHLQYAIFWRNRHAARAIFVGHFDAESCVTFYFALGLLDTLGQLECVQQVNEWKCRICCWKHHQASEKSGCGCEVRIFCANDFDVPKMAKVMLTSAGKHQHDDGAEDEHHIDRAATSSDYSLTLRLLSSRLIAMKCATTSVFLSLALLSAAGNAFSVTPTMAATTAVGTEPKLPATKSVVSKVAVAGATGRTGRFVVNELLNRGCSVVAMVRDEDKAKELFSELSMPKGLELVTCDLTSEAAIDSAVNGCDAAIWCATGFSDAPGDGIVNKLKKLVGIALAPQQSIDSVGVPALAKSFQSAPKETKCPKVVMLSSAGVTRPAWDEARKTMFPGSAEIPIVRLNPFGILDIKRESEEKLRQSGVDYCIVRPAGLNDDWPAGSRPVFSQGDVAVGRINRQDVAKILVDVLSTPEATGKTFEAITLAGYPPATSIDPALAKLRTDKEGLPSLESIEATYTAMQQLLPGEKQDSVKIAVGQTYEQLDKGEEGRFGPRDNENVEQVTATIKSKN
jgi:uncharacterized protein YbjT (DUF2867 family)